VIPPRLLSREIGLDVIQFILVRNKTVIEMPALEAGKRYLVIDDIYDTGGTCRKVSDTLKDFRCDFCFCMMRHENHGITGKVLNHDKWIVFPWE
jgi:uncharacterized protein